MGLRVAIQMDPVGSLAAEKDSTFLLAQEAQRRGCEVWHFTPEYLSWNKGRILAHANRLRLGGISAPSYTLGKEAHLDLRKMDVVLMRQNPPFNMNYISNTYLLEMLAPDVLVTNNPASVRNYPEKLLPTFFAQFMPPTLITTRFDDIKHFRAQEKNIVLKPLYGYSGYSVFTIKAGDKNTDSQMASILKKNPEPWVAQRFLPEMKDGERRLLFVDGKLSGVLARIPGEGQNNAGFQGGAKYIKSELTAKQKNIAAAIGPLLKKHGLLFAGADIIGNYLTEINVTSPGSLWGMERVYGKSLQKNIWNSIEKKL